MNFDAIVSDLKGRVEPVLAKGQDAFLASLGALKEANGIVVESAQELAKTNAAVGKELFGHMQVSVSKVKEDGFKAVLASPLDYLPEGKALVVSAYQDSVKLVSSASDSLGKVATKGYKTVAAAWGDTPKPKTRRATSRKPRRASTTRAKSATAAPAKAAATPAPAKRKRTTTRKSAAPATPPPANDTPPST